ncbi:MAG TPA: DUF177 domain-containing protein [Gaiellales bacterium]|jgi:uncharacterized protein|nr:DUF177 domain-containing protein [Gaiellales bacterium]
MLDLRQYGLRAGDSRRVELPLDLEPVVMGGQTYQPEPAAVVARLDLQATPDGFYLRLRFGTEIVGPCVRCLDPARVAVEIDAAEYHEPDAAAESDEETVSDYLDDLSLDIERWARDALVLAVPGNVLCRPDCRGLCPVCGANLNDDPGHSHPREQFDERWAALRELRDGGDGDAPA